MGARTRPSAYVPPMPFHAVRALTFVSVIIVGGVLASFCVQLTQDDFKLPWTFLVMLLADAVLLLSLMVGTVLYFCVHLSPLLNMIMNIPILLLWTVGLGLLIWNMYGTLGHSCTAANWGNEDGIMICHQYKAFFAFVVIGWLCQIALIILDVRARRTQSALGRYNKMRDSQDLKMDPLHSRESSVHDLPMGTGLDGAAQRMHSQQDQQQMGFVQRTESRRVPSRQSSFYSTAAPTYTTEPTYQNTPYTSNQDGYQAYNPTPRFDPAYSAGHNVHSMQDFGYQAPAQQTQYDNYYSRR